jgi:hypothetical protein
MHASAALPHKDGSQRPCVVLAGGRETPNWEQYPTHQFLHNVGSLPCCNPNACWKIKCQNKENNENDCLRPQEVYYEEKMILIPECMNKITPNLIVEAIKQYL